LYDFPVSCGCIFDFPLTINFLQTQSDVHINTRDIKGKSLSERSSSIRLQGAVLSRRCALVHALASIMDGGYIDRARANMFNWGGDITIHKRLCPLLPVYCDPCTTLQALKEVDIVRGNTNVTVSHLIVSAMSINSNCANTGMLRLSKVSVEELRATQDCKNIQAAHIDYKESKRIESIVSDCFVCIWCVLCCWCACYNELNKVSLNSHRASFLQMK